MDETPDTPSTREQILNAASDIFMQKGINGAATQEITDRAGVNKAMLYYYFDSKEKLFVEVFRKAVRESGLKTVDLLETDLPLFDKIREFIDTFIDRLLERPLIISFVMNELNRYPELLAQVFMEEIGFKSVKLDEQLNEAADSYEIARVDSRHLLANLITLCLGPLVNKQFYTEMLDLKEDNTYKHFLNERKGIIYDTTISWLTS